MAVWNKTGATIILPSRHRLQPGLNEVSDDLLASKANTHFVALAELRGQICRNAPKPQSRNVVRPIVAGEAVKDGLPKSRFALAEAKPAQVEAWVAVLGLQAGKVDDMRQAVAVAVFGD